MKKLLICFISVAILSSCAGITSYKSLKKEETLALIYKNNPEYCQYSGKTVVRYQEQKKDTVFLALLKKECKGDMEAKITGPLGIIIASIEVKNGAYKIIKDNEDVTAIYSSIFPQENISTINRFMKTPPITLDESWDMQFADSGSYTFSKNGTKVIVSMDYKIDEVITRSYTIRYKWDRNTLKSIELLTGETKIEVEFLGKWQ